MTIDKARQHQIVADQTGRRRRSGCASAAQAAATVGEEMRLRSSELAAAPRVQL